MPKRSTASMRRTLFDSMTSADGNLYCERKNLTNEASVETFFVNRLLEDLDYRDAQIKAKQSIDARTVALGSRSVNYRPDYVLTYRKRPRWVIDAKHPGENLDKWVGQCGGYCLQINQTFKAGENPVKWFMLTNGVQTRVYEWDHNTPLLSLDFSEFVSGNPNYEKLRSILAASSVVEARPTDTHTFKFHRPSAQQAKALFAQCHRIIWKSGMGRTGAFMEFTKLMFVKLWCDRQLREDSATKALLEQAGEVKLPKDSVAFSTHWIDKEKLTASPVNDILFKRLRDDIEADIATRKKKRIFDADERIGMRPDTIRLVVEKLQHWDMFGIDEDLNGRLFETFLNATMRGKDLGQYFTPRSVVKLVTRLADLKVTPTKVEKAIDACCGTGGFLIEVLTEMRNAVRNNASLTPKQRDDLIDTICNDSIYGVDFGHPRPPRSFPIALWV